MSGTKRAVAAVALLAVVGVVAFLARSNEDAPSAETKTPAAPAATSTHRSRAAAPTSTGREAPAAGHVIAGRVTAIPAGAPVRVEARRTGDCPAAQVEEDEAHIPSPPRAGPLVAQTQAAADGSFALPLATSGTYVVSAVASDGREASASVEVPDVLPRVECEIALPDGPHALRGRVVRADGAPFRGFVEFESLETRFEGTIAPIWTIPNAEGRFAFVGLPRGRAQIDALVPGEGATWTEVSLPTSGEMELRIQDATRHGRVVSAVDGAAIGGARVSSCNGEWRREVVADAAGAFVVPASRRIVVGAVAPGFASTSFDASAEGSECDGRLPRITTDEIVLRLERTGSVGGRVLRSDGTPVAGAHVVVDPHPGMAYSAPSRRSVTSDADGAYRVDDVQPGKALVYVLGGGWASIGFEKYFPSDNPFSVDVASGATTTVDLRVRPAARVEGRALGPDGKPVRGARVESASITWTDADGAFAFGDLLPGDQATVIGTIPGLPSASANFAPTSGETAHVELRFAAPQRLEVVVTSADGAPVSKARVDLWAMQEDGTGGGGGEQRSTDDQGRCVFADAPEGKLGVGVTAPGFVAVGQSNDPVFGTHDADDARHWRVEVRLVRGYLVSGKVLHSDGSTVAGLELELTRPVDGIETPICAGKETGDDGSFRFEDVPAGTYSLTRFPEERLTSVVVAGDTVANIQLPEGVAFTFVGPDGTPVPQGYCEIVGAGNGWAELFKNGRVVVELKHCEIDGAAITAGEPSDASGEPLSLGTVTVKIPHPLPKTIAVRFPPERVANGRIVAQDGRGVVGAKLRAHFGSYDRVLCDAVTNADGAFEIHQLGEGEFVLDVDPPDVFLPPPKTTIHGGDKDIVITLAAAAVGVVTVLDADGKPVRGAVIEVRPADVETKSDEEPPKPLAHVVSDADGKARVAGLVPGARLALSVAPPANRDDVAAFAASSWTPADTTVHLVRPDAGAKK